MGKGFNKARNKQAELKKKMAIAKAQNNEQKGGENKTIDTTTSGGDVDISRTEGREAFEALLRTTKGAIPSGDDTESAYIAPMQAGNSKTKKKKSGPKPKPPKQKTKAREKKGQRDEHRQSIVEAQRRHFESLLDAETSAPLGAIGAAKLVPWVPPFLKTCLIVFVDPRSNSNDLRKTMRYHASSSLVTAPSSGKGGVDVAFVTADSVGETQA